MRVREMFMALMAARHSSRAPTLSVMVKWMVVFPGTMVASVHLCKCAGDEADILVSRFVEGCCWCCVFCWGVRRGDNEERREGGEGGGGGRR